MPQEKKYSLDYRIKDIFVMKYAPQVRYRVIHQRARSSFMLVLDGRYHYQSEQIDFYVEAGDTVYLPASASYQYRILSEKTECIQIEFSMAQSTDGIEKETVFALDPLVLKGQNNRLDLIFSELIKQYQNDEYMTLSLLYQLCSVLVKNCKRNDLLHGGRAKIEPAVAYIKKNYTDRIYIPQLARMCNLSESHLRRLFNKYLGFSPIEYKNAILLDAACNMLRSKNTNVSETAEALGFNDIYTFSQFFKKEMGISPRQYLENSM